MAPAGQAATHVPQPWHSAAVDLGSRFARSWYSMALYGHRSLQIRHPEQRASSTVARMGSRAISCCWILPRMRAAAAAPLETLAGMSRGPSAQPAAKTPSVMVATGSSLGWRSITQPSELQPMPKRRATSWASWVGSRPTDRIDHVHRDASLAPGQRVLHLDDQPAVLRCLVGHAQHIGHLRHPAADEGGALLLDAPVELVVTPFRACACRCRTRRPPRRCAPARGARTSATACSRSPSSTRCSCGRGCRRNG